jgi:Methyltransferase domain/Arginine methyltransferase oligomerization subdomain/Tetratricopeptide repeat
MRTEFWRDDLMAALHSGKPDYMAAMLARVPREVLHQAIPAISAIATTLIRQNELDQALTYLDQLVGIDGDNPRWWAERAELHLHRGAFVQAIADARHLATLRPGDPRGLCLQGDIHSAQGDRSLARAAYSAALAVAPGDSQLRDKLEQLASQEGATTNPPLPPIQFDPVLFADPSFPPGTAEALVEGLTRHLRRYGQHQAVRTTIGRIRDPRWIQLWRSALSGCHGAAVVFHGSELGILPLLALDAGARKVTIVSTDPLDRRISAGIVQKHRLLQWRDTHVNQIATMDMAQRQASFEAFNASIDFVTQDKLENVECDWLVFPAFDHTLVGTGLAAALQPWRQRTVPRLLPSRAQLFAMGIRWMYPGAAGDLSPVSSLRWSPYPDVLESPAQGWEPVTETVEVGSLDPWNLQAATISRELRALNDGALDAILFWYRVQLGEQVLDTGAEGGVGGLRPAVHYVDTRTVVAGQAIMLNLHIEPTRLRFELEPPRRAVRRARLPSWYVPMIIDQPRNQAFRDALGRLRAEDLVLEIGAGCGLLSMMAADAGAHQVIGCEIEPAIHAVAHEVLQRNGYGEQVRLINKDCRHLILQEDLPSRADLVLFEMFDCGLIGEGILHFLAYVREHLAHTGTRYLPKAARVRACIVEHRLERVADVDVNVLNAFCFTPSYSNVDARHLGYRALTEPFEVFTFDFARADPQPQQIKLDLSASVAGIGGAVLFWFDLQLDESRWLSNAPGAEPSYHWGQALQFLPEMAVEPGMPLPLVARHQGSGINFVWHEAELPQRAFSRIPRADPATWAQAMELESQTGQILQFSRSNAQEYARIADLALRIAVDPALYHIDPRVALRFASMFI